MRKVVALKDSSSMIEFIRDMRIESDARGKIANRQTLFKNNSKLLKQSDSKQDLKRKTRQK